MAKYKVGHYYKPIDNNNLFYLIRIEHEYYVGIWIFLNNGEFNSITGEDMYRISVVDEKGHWTLFS